jgi:serine/threonine protein kinase
VIRSPQPGDVLGERYRVIDVVGSGGMGVVYRAQNVVTNKYVALKWLQPRFSSGVGSDRLLREARAASLLKHPHIVDVYDLTKDTASDTWVLVMELLQGETLRDYMLRSRQVKLSTFISLLLPAMGAVVAAHELGIVHRDLKPENIFLERVPSANRLVPKVLDFGIAKLNEPGGRSLTATGTTLGTPFYMSPEQYLGEKAIDARADVYAFGTMLYEAITGRMPHAASSLPELALKVTTVDPTPVKTLCPSVPSSLARLVDWALARRREDRIATLEQLQDELELFAREHSFRDQLTHSDASTPLMAAPAVTAETLAETQLGVRVPEPLPPVDQTPPPAARTHRPSLVSRQSSWIGWSAALLLLASCALLYQQKTALETRLVHASAQPIEAAALSGEALQSRACGDAEPLEPEPLALAPLPLPDASVQPPQPEPLKRPAKIKKPSTGSGDDPKQNISKILAF